MKAIYSVAVVPIANENAVEVVVDGDSYHHEHTFTAFKNAEILAKRVHKRGTINPEYWRKVS